MGDSPVAAAVQAMCKVKGYKFFTSGVYNLNLFGVRRRGGVNLFNDALGAVFRQAVGNPLTGRVWAGTTDPGSWYLRQPMNSGGTAIVVPGQYPGLWTLGLHKGQDAFKQVGPVTVYRDGDRDNELDMDPGSRHTGIFGIDGHRAGTNSQLVDRWSAGCQVWKRSTDLLAALSLARCQVHANPTWPVKFTYTLFDADDPDLSKDDVGLIFSSIEAQ